MQIPGEMGPYETTGADDFVGLIGVKYTSHLQLGISAFYDGISSSFII